MDKENTKTIENRGSVGKAARDSKRLLKTCLAALFAALTAAGTFISIPVPVSPVPIVLQNLFALLSGLVLGPFLGGAAVALYLAAGALGVPVFAGAIGGAAHFAGPTGGFLFGYLLAAVTGGLIAGRPKASRPAPAWRIILAVFAGLLVVYVPGVIWLKISRSLSWAQALAGGFAPFIIGDALKGLIAAAVAPRLRKAAADHLDG
jgi:biotin transport system substrate-specific component